jgi:hypothetical protein
VGGTQISSLSKSHSHISRLADFAAKLNLFSLVSHILAKRAAKAASIRNAPAFINQMTVIKLIEMWPIGLVYKLLRIFERQVSEK